MRRKERRGRSLGVGETGLFQTTVSHSGWQRLVEINGKCWAPLLGGLECQGQMLVPDVCHGTGIRHRSSEQDSRITHKAVHVGDKMARAAAEAGRLGGGRAVVRPRARQWGRSEGGGRGTKNGADVAANSCGGKGRGKRLRQCGSFPPAYGEGALVQELFWMTVLGRPCPPHLPTPGWEGKASQLSSSPPQSAGAKWRVWGCPSCRPQDQCTDGDLGSWQRVG